MKKAVSLLLTFIVAHDVKTIFLRILRGEIFHIIISLCRSMDFLKTKYGITWRLIFVHWWWTQPKRRHRVNSTRESVFSSSLCTPKPAFDIARTDAVDNGYKTQCSGSLLCVFLLGSHSHANRLLRTSSCAKNARGRYCPQPVPCHPC